MIHMRLHGYVCLILIICIVFKIKIDDLMIDIFRKYRDKRKRREEKTISQNRY